MMFLSLGSVLTSSLCNSISWKQERQIMQRSASYKQYVFQTSSTNSAKTVQNFGFTTVKIVTLITDFALQFIIWAHCRKEVVSSCFMDSEFLLVILFINDKVFINIGRSNLYTEDIWPLPLGLHFQVTLPHRLAIIFFLLLCYVLQLEHKITAKRKC